MSIANKLRLRADLSRILHRRILYPSARSSTTSEGHRPTIVHKQGLDILHDPWFNKGTAFTITERNRLEIRGLLPPNVMDSEQQIQRFMTDLKRLEEQARDGPSDPNTLAKWRILNRLLDRNETMYYKYWTWHSSIWYSHHLGWDAASECLAAYMSEEEVLNNYL